MTAVAVKLHTEGDRAQAFVLEDLGGSILERGASALMYVGAR